MDINAGDTAWLLASSALVLLMTPGLAFFYGGLTRAKSTLNMMMMSFVTICIIGTVGGLRVQSRVRRLEFQWIVGPSRGTVWPPPRPRHSAQKAMRSP